MGFTVNDQITLENGLPVTGAYVSFNGGQVISIEYGVSCALRATLNTAPPALAPPLSNTAPPALVTPTSNTAASSADSAPDPFANVLYTISGTYSLWINKQAKINGTKPLQTFRVDYGLKKTEINQPPLELLYTYVKSKFSNVEDDV